MQLKILKHRIYSHSILYFNFDLVDSHHHNIVEIMQELGFILQYGCKWPEAPQYFRFFSSVHGVLSAGTPSVALATNNR